MLESNRPMLVHKAIEPSNLSVRGQHNLEQLLSTDQRNALLLPKLDGVYVQFRHTYGGWRAFSRTGELMPSMETPARLERLHARANASTIYVGEAWTPKTQHAAINGMARRQQPQEGLELWLHDAFDEAAVGRYGFDRRPFLERFDAALQVADRDAHLMTVPYMRVKDVAYLMGDVTLDNLLAYTKSVQQHALSLGNVYDGLILRDDSMAFKPGPGKDGGIYKLKPRKSLDLRIVGEFVTERETKLGGYLTVVYRGKTTDVGSGVTQGMLMDMMENRRVQASKPTFIGSIAEIEFLEFTKDGRLREPVLKSIRFDKEEPDA